MTIFVHQDLMRGELFKAEKTAFSFDNGLTIRLFSGMDSIPANFNRDTDVIVTTQEELSRIASGVMKVDPKITSSARMLGVETDRSEGHPFLREILVSAILLGSLDESDIREKSATYESFRTIVGLLKGREISAEEVKGLIMASGIEPGAIVDRAKRILRLLITKPMVKFDTEAVKTERQVLWAA
jgi:hypothetical protein